MPGLRPAAKPPVKAPASGGDRKLATGVPTKKTAGENLKKVLATPTPSMSDLDLQLAHPSHLTVDYRTAIPFSVSVTQEVPVELRGRKLHVQVIVALSPWGLIDYMEGKDDLGAAKVELDALVREIASRLEIV